MSAEFNLQFLRRVQRLLDEGDFSATYKYALLRALADLSVERPIATDGGLQISVREIAEKFIEYYWRQVRPYRNELLFQSNKGQAEVITKIARYQARNTHVLAAAQKSNSWRQLVSQVSVNVEQDPLRRLQRLPTGDDCFLYDNPPNKGAFPAEKVSVRLHPGIAAAFQAFHPLVISLLESAWARRIISIKSNVQLQRDLDDLGEFLFGSERQPLDGYREVLRETHGSNCFYCERPLRTAVQVDHFISWSRYPVDLGHNFVLACSACNENKREHLPSVRLLEKWRVLNLDRAITLANAFRRRNLPEDHRRTFRVAWWAYEQAEAAQAHTWAGRRSFVPLVNEWRLTLRPAGELQRAAEDPEIYD